jgi:hypothetical protein
MQGRVHCRKEARTTNNWMEKTRKLLVLLSQGVVLVEKLFTLFGKFHT